MWTVHVTWAVTLMMTSVYAAEPFLKLSEGCSRMGGSINCSYRQLYQVPNDLPASAVSLNLSHNLLSNLSDDVFHNLTSLSVLDLSYNYLSSFTPSVFVGLHNLQWLSVTWNNLPLSDETYPSGVFSPFSQSLLYLYLNGNSPPNQSQSLNVSYPDKALSELLNLTELFMDGLKETRFKSGFGHLQSLTNLSLLGSQDGFCDIEILYNDTFKHHPPALEYLNLSYCNIRFIEADAFSPLRTLQILDLSHNEDLGFQRLGLAVYGLQGSALHTLYINHINHPYDTCVQISSIDTTHFKNTSITSIYAKHNSLQFFSPGALPNMPDSLQFVSLDGNHLRFGRYLQDLNKLKRLKIIHNDGYNHPPKTPTHYPVARTMYDDVDRDVSEASLCENVAGQCRWSVISDKRKERSWLPALGYEATSTAADNSTHFVLPPELTDLQCSENQIYYKLMQIDFDPSNNLSRMDLSNNFFVTLIGPITGLDKLQYLNLRNNMASHISDDFFRNLSSLKVLNLNRNTIVNLMTNSTRSTFAPLINLETLDLSENNIYIFPNNVFTGLIHLKVLNLSHNNLISLDINISSSKSLRLIDLAYNNINSLPNDMRSHLDTVAQATSETVIINLTYNHIICMCQNIEFLSWMQNTKVHFPNVTKYNCLMSDGSVKSSINIFEVIADLQKECSSYIGIIVGTVCCCCCLLVAVVSALMYRFRWKLRYWYYASRMSYRGIQSQEARQFDYDAFVSYASDDEDFVRSQLVHNLEVQENLRLNVHYRDFMPAQPIPCNIVAAVESSRRTLVVLTRHLLQSDWCQYEMQMATMEAVHTGRDVLVFLLYEDIPSHELPRHVLYNLQSSTYIRFPGEDTMLPTFWSRLAHAIRM